MSNGDAPMTVKPSYRFTGRRPVIDAHGRVPGFTDRLTWRNEHPPHDTIEISEWAFWRLWYFHPGNAAHPQSIYHHTPLQKYPDL
jgi:hypothetical protein